MRKKLFLSIVAMIAAIALGTSCDSSIDEFNLDVDSEITSTEVIISVSRNNENGIVTGTKNENGTIVDTTIVVPLGGVNFEISPLETISATDPKVESLSFEATGSKTKNWEAEGISYTKTTKSYSHSMTGYMKDITISYLDAEMTLWGKKVVFPKANGEVSLPEKKISVADEGINSEVHYYLSTSYYTVSSMNESREERGYERLAIDAKDNLQSTSKTNEGYETLSSNTAKSWIEITRVYSQSGTVKSKYEVILRNGISAPAYEIRTVEDFDLKKKNATSGKAIVSGTRTEGNITVTNYSSDYVVGCDLFDKKFTFSWETAVLKTDGQTFEMPSRHYEDINDKAFKLTAMSDANGYERKLYTHTVSSTFNKNSADATAEVELHKKAEDKMIERVVIEDGLETLDETTSKSWIKVKEVWSVSGTRVYVKHINLENGINSPAKIVRVLDNFELKQKTASLGEKVLVSTETLGDFTIRTYNRIYQVGNDKFSREFVLSYQKAFYDPLDYSMPFAEYESASDEGFTMEDIAQITENGKAYDRKNYVHSMSVNFNGNRAEAKSEAELRVVAKDVMTNQEIIEDGMDFVDDNTTKSWIKIKEMWSVSGEKVYTKSVDLKNSIAAPNKITKILDNFALASASPTLADETLQKTETAGDFEVKTYQRAYTVRNDKFDRVFTLTYQRAMYKPIKHNMPNPEYKNLSDAGFNTEDMSNTVDGDKTYGRKKYVHNISGSFNERNIKSSAEAELWVEVNDQMTSQVILEEGFEYINNSTSKSWIKVKEVWSVSGEKIYEKSVSLKNGITAPEKLVKVIDNFNLRANGPSYSGEKLVNTVTEGEFKVMTYERTYTVANDKFDRIFKLSYQKAIYNPLTHNMPSREYENPTDKGFRLGDMSQQTQDGKIYDRKSYTHTMSAVFNAHSEEASAEAELLVFNHEDRDTPSWLGAPKGAKYTRVQQSVGSKFMDMIVFQYENGVVMAPNGVVDMNLAYAFDNSVAAANGVDKCISGAYSGVFGNGKWQPATISEIGGRWIYAGISSSWDHTVMELEAVALGIGVDVTPTPKAQAVKIEGNTITISYAVGNGSKTANTSLSLK